MKTKPKKEPAPRTVLKCEQPFDEALRRAMLVKPPPDWKKRRKANSC